MLCAQDRDLVTPAASMDRLTRWEATWSQGILVPHRASIRAMRERPARSVQVAWVREGQGLWSCMRENPRWGVAARWTDTGAPQYIGSQANLLGFASLSCARSLRLRLGGGVGWTQSPWDANSPEGRQRVVIGSPFNAAIEVSLGRELPFITTRPADHWGWQLAFSHQSNASVTQPNLGTNVLTFGIQTSWTAARAIRPLPNDTTAVLSVLPAPIQGWLVHAGVGRRQPAPLSQRETTWEGGIDWRWGGLRAGAIVGGLAFCRPQQWGAGLHAGVQLRFHRVQVDLVHGRCLKRWQPEEASYNRVVFRLFSGGPWWVHLGLLTHGFRAHHPTLGVGWAMPSLSHMTRRREKGSQGDR